MSLPVLTPHCVTCTCNAGADAISDKNLLVTSDFVNPVTTVTSQVFSLPVASLLNQTAEVHDLVSSESAIVTRNTVRVWDLSDLSSIKNTIILPGAQGVIDIKVRWVGWGVISSKEASTSASGDISLRGM
jgi:hypothetical protein